MSRKFAVVLGSAGVLVLFGAVHRGGRPTMGFHFPPVCGSGSS